MENLRVSTYHRDRVGQKERVEIETQRGDFLKDTQRRAQLELRPESDLLHLGLGFCHLHSADADSPK